MRIYYFNFNYVVKKIIIVLVVLLTVLFAYKLIQYNLFKPTVTKFEPIYHGSEQTKKIALTCNVVWGEEYVPQMLEILKKNNVKMTFYVGGQWAKDFPELTLKMAKSGHELGNHSYSHPHPTFISKAENAREIETTEQAVYKAAQTTTRLYAPPYGEFNSTVLEAAGQLGYKTILWSIDTIDWQRPPAKDIARRVSDKAHNGAIVLMHPTAPTIEALPTIIENLKKRGYELTTVSDVIGLNVTTE
jgi:probable sporulation protein (polysaccharide deacetylase family)